MTNDELLDIEARLYLATPGPWEVQPDGWTIREQAPGGEQGHRVAHTYSVPPEGSGYSSLYTEQQVNDAFFIAEARTDVENLLAAVKNLREAYAKDLKWCNECISWGTTCQGCATLLTKLRAADERAEASEARVTALKETLSNFRIARACLEARDNQ